MKFKTEFGEVFITPEVIAKMVGIAAVECYGVIGMASQKQVKDGIADLLGWNNLEKGIIVKEIDNNEISVEVHVIIAFGTRISEVAGSIQTKIKYTLQEAIGINVAQVDICVDGVKIIDAPK